jgi:hypothetical protein
MYIHENWSYAELSPSQNASGHSLSEGRIQSQLALRATWRALNQTKE